MTNAEWIIKTGKDFVEFEADIQDNKVVIYYQGKKFTTVHAIAADTSEFAIKRWFDSEYSIELKPAEKEWLKALNSVVTPYGSGHYITIVYAPLGDRREDVRVLEVVDKIDRICYARVYLGENQFKSLVPGVRYSDIDLGIEL